MMILIVIWIANNHNNGMDVSIYGTKVVDKIWRDG